MGRIYTPDLFCSETNLQIEFKPASLWREGRHHHSLCHQVNLFKPASLWREGRHHHSLCHQATSTSRRVLVPLPTITIFNIRSAARRPTCVEPARPWLSEGVKSLQRGRKISAWRGHEDSGGEGQLGREPGRPGGDQFFP